MECDLNNWNYLDFIKRYLVFYHEDHWPRVIYHIMYDLEYFDPEKCKKISKKLIKEKNKCTKKHLDTESLK